MDLIPCLSDQEKPLDDLINDYFIGGYTYEEIREFLRIHHGHDISLSTLKRNLKRKNLFRRPLNTRRCSVNELEAAIQNDLEGSGAQLGYRRVWASLKSKGLIVRREDVRKTLLNIDPEGVDQRRRHRLSRRTYRNPGPNFVWHIDGHDKLKPFGFSIHGCIDSYSRRLIWLEVSSSNKVPELIARYYLEAITQLKGIPNKIKADDGTEHSLIEPIHISLRDSNGDCEALDTFSIVSSPVNQRIEAYWSKLRRDRPGWWVSFFKDLVDRDLYDPSDAVLLDCARFCFMRLIREEIRTVKQEWNQHLIFKSKNGGPSGRPNTMYFLPHLHGGTNFLKDVDLDEVSEFSSISIRTVEDFSDEFGEFATTLMAQDGWNVPDNFEGCFNLYAYLIQKIAEYS